MNVVSRGVRNAFRNTIRTVSIVVILGLSVGLALAMLVARQAVEQKINSVKASVGTNITVSPAGVRGFEGGGNPLTQTEVNKISGLSHVTSITESLNDRLTSTDTNLVSSIDAGSLGQRFAQTNGGNFQAFGGTGGSSGNTTTFTPPITVLASTDPTNLASTQGGGTFTLKSGKVFAAASTANVALIGSSLATKNNLSVGSTFTAYSTTITVAGIFDAGNTFSNDQLIMPLTTLQTLSGQAGDITSAVVTADSVSNVASLTKSIESQLGSAADVTNEAEQAQNSIAPLDNVKSIALYSLIGAIIAGSVIILLTMIMIVRERRREIGVLKAIGASNPKVMLQFMTEAVTLTVLGAIIGIIIGVVGGNPITKTLVNNNSNTGSSSVQAARPGGFGGQRRTMANIAPNSTGTTTINRSGAFRGLRNNVADIHAAVGWNIILYGFAAAIIIALLGSSAAAWFIGRVRPAEVMRVE